MKVEYIIISVALALCSVLLKTNHRRFECALLSALLLWAIFESGWGILQAMGLAGASKHQYYLMIGSFGNPGPYGGFIAVMMAVAVATFLKYRQNDDINGKIIKDISIVAIALGMIVLPSSRSRAGWVGLLFSMSFLLIKNNTAKDWLRKHKMVVALSIVGFLGIAVWAYSLKPDSAIGRLHIWNMECKVIAKHPISGVGIDKVFNAYGEVQEEYFRAGQRPESVVRVAGAPKYAYNEYLKFGMAYGVPGLLASLALAILIISLLTRSGSPLAYGAIAYSVFATASFPLGVVQLKIILAIFISEALAGAFISLKSKRPSYYLSFLLVVFLLVGSLLIPKKSFRRDAERRWLSSPYIRTENYDLSVNQLSPLFSQLKDNCEFLYDYGYSLHRIKRYEESNDILQMGAALSSDPMFYNIIAKNYISLGEFGEAEKALYKSHYIVPCRIYPLYLLMKMYYDNKQFEKAAEIGYKISGMPVNENNPNMAGLKEDAFELMLELNEMIDNN